jgi:hypothetical protein
MWGIMSPVTSDVQAEETLETLRHSMDSFYSLFPDSEFTIMFHTLLELPFQICDYGPVWELINFGVER